MRAARKKSKIETLLDREEWSEARALIETELESCPDNHWLLVQLGVTYYEQGRYHESLERFIHAQRIVPDCPLVLWNLAGALDAIGQSRTAAQLFVHLIESNKTAAEDSCWESAAWTDSLKTDCVYRLGVALQHVKKWKLADRCFRHYINLLLAGRAGTYSANDAASRIREAHAYSKPNSAKELRAVTESILEDSTLQSKSRKPLADQLARTLGSIKL